MPNFFVDVRQYLVYAYGCPSRLVRPIWKIPTSKPNVFVDVRQDLVYAYGWPSRLVRPILKHTIFWVIRITTSKMPNVFVDVLQDRVYPSGWPSRSFRPILKVKRALKRAYPSFRRFSCAIANYFLGDPDSDVKNSKFFLDVRQDLVYASGWPSRPFRSILKIPTSKMPNFFVDVRQDLVYASGWPSRPFRPILKVKRAPKRAYPSFRQFSCAIANHFLGDPDSDAKNAKFFCGRSARPCLCIRLALTAFPIHFEGQMSPGASIHLISTIFRVL
uniref:Uncharacterized protein n=1 Tax=Solanum lycopersicum TaxID=4081 RepID=A0A3Q7H355_SOLLC